MGQTDPHFSQLTDGRSAPRPTRATIALAIRQDGSRASHETAGRPVGSRLAARATPSDARGGARGDGARASPSDGEGSEARANGVMAKGKSNPKTLEAVKRATKQARQADAASGGGDAPSDPFDMQQSYLNAAMPLLRHHFSTNSRVLPWKQSLVVNLHQKDGSYTSSVTMNSQVKEVAKA